MLSCKGLLSTRGHGWPCPKMTSIVSTKRWRIPPRSKVTSQFEMTFYNVRRIWVTKHSELNENHHLYRSTKWSQSSLSEEDLWSPCLMSQISSKWIASQIPHLLYRSMISKSETSSRIFHTNFLGNLWGGARILSQESQLNVSIKIMFADLFQRTCPKTN